MLTSPVKDNVHSAPLLPGQRDGVKQQSVAAPRLDDHDPLNLTVSKTKSFSVRVKTPSQALMFLRFLLAKVVYRRDLKVLSVPELVLLNESWEILRKVKDPTFWNETNRQTVSSLTQIDSVRQTILNPNWDHTTWWNMLEARPGLPSRHAYFGWWKTFRIKVWFRFRNRLLDSKSPQKRFIGVGYRDQGTAQDVAYDGSPSWQEVAGVRLFLYETREPLGVIPFIP